MRIIAASTLHGFVENRVDPSLQALVRAQLKTWYRQTSAADWQNSGELKQSVRNASVLTNERVVFNVKGNEYRLVVAISYAYGVVLIKWLGTHREYDRIDAAEVEYEKQRYTGSSDTV